MKTKILTLALALLCLWTGAVAQVLQPLEWSAELLAQSDSMYEVRARGEFSDAKWHIYDMQDYGPAGPIPTVMTISGPGVIPEGEPRIVSPVERSYDDIFGMEIGTCGGSVEIVQALRFEGEPGEVELRIEWQCCSGGACLAPDEYTTLLRPGESYSHAQSVPAGRGGLWALILEAIAWGLVALLTPCVFPMIPMTVSFFLKKGGRLHAAMFGLFIVALYTLPIAIIILVTYLGGGASVTADIFNWLATHWLPNVIFFVVFMLFAASFLGAFEITLPSSLVNKSDARSDRGGLAGVFFIALTLVLVSFSCTGPIVGSVLIKSTQGQFWEPIITMLAFSLSFAAPFTVLAFAPSLLKKLPRSGSWLGSVKIVLGFIEIALGLKFLSVADQTYHWGILDREIYLGIWIIVFLLLGLFLLGILKFKSAPHPGRLSPLRISLAVVDLAFVLYMLPGMWGAPLKALSGYLPPITTQHIFAGKYASQKAVPAAWTGGEPRKYADFLSLPYGIPAFYEYEQARAYALACGKPLLLDFTGHGCVNCREMESRVWSDPRVLKMMKEDYVVCALFADDKKQLPESEWVTTPGGRVLKNLGKINSWFMQERFGVNAQPYYAILDPATGRHKVPPRGYDLDIDAFVGFLTSGLK